MDDISTVLRIGDRLDLSDAGHTIAYHIEIGLRTTVNALLRRGISRWRRQLDGGVIEFAGEILLVRDTQLENDLGLIV